MEGDCGTGREGANERATPGQVLALTGSTGGLGPLEHKHTHRVVPALKQERDSVTPGPAIHQLPAAHWPRLLFGKLGSWELQRLRTRERPSEWGTNSRTPDPPAGISHAADWDGDHRLLRAYRVAFY